MAALLLQKRFKLFSFYNNKRVALSGTGQPEKVRKSAKVHISREGLFWQTCHPETLPGNEKKAAGNVQFFRRGLDLRNKRDATRLGYAVFLKWFQHEGRFPSNHAEVPLAIVAHIASQVDVETEIWSEYPWQGRSVERNRASLRSFCGFREATLEDGEKLEDWLVQEVLTRGQMPERIQESAFDYCRKRSIEPPGPERLKRIIVNAVNRQEILFCERCSCSGCVTVTPDSIAICTSPFQWSPGFTANSPESTELANLKWRNSVDSAILSNMPKPEITKPNTVESFIKANSTLRVGVDAVSCFLEQLNTLSETIVKAAEANAKQKGRTTIMAADVNVAMVLATGSTSDLSLLFKKLEYLNAKDTADLSTMI